MTNNLRHWPKRRVSQNHWHSGAITDTPLGTKRLKKTDNVDEDGVLVDIDVISISKNTSKVRRADGALDLAHFYEDKVKDITGDKPRESRKCKICKWVFFILWVF
jgi:hypothetical protein